MSAEGLDLLRWLGPPELDGDDWERGMREAEAQVAELRAENEKWQKTADHFSHVNDAAQRELAELRRKLQASFNTLIEQTQTISDLTRALEQAEHKIVDGRATVMTMQKKQGTDLSEAVAVSWLASTHNALKDLRAALSSAQSESSDMPPCQSCGATEIFYDPGDGWSCSRCGLSDSGD